MSPLHWLCLAFIVGTAYGTIVTLLAVRLVLRSIKLDVTVRPVANEKLPAIH